jgi:hypothetical protein
MKKRENKRMKSHYDLTLCRKVKMAWNDLFRANKLNNLKETTE